ncbi:GH92 family glycosyl hydrolase [Halosquirtibacter xylanolyticus]|uniref:GH92 family glycosyl hydrolase n=1 Tax=Halosquirtibacter xylanolyticus TaxID=3374599 RepID=UPI00374A9545|nr:GH92 family glycosyl hydrolase [Prolixibacteraceae bacterium]
MKNLLLLIMISYLWTSCNTKTSISARHSLTSYVDPFIGTGGHGHTFPGATTPFGMVQLSPDTHLDGWEASSGYHYQDSIIYGFSHTHLSGTGIGDLGDISILPFSVAWNDSIYGAFDKSSEKASPGFYEVYLKNNEVLAKLTATPRVGIHRYEYKNPSQRKILINLEHTLQQNWGHTPMNSRLSIIDNKTIEGIKRTTGWAYKHQVAFRMEFSEPFNKSTFHQKKGKNNTKDAYGKDISLELKFPKTNKPLIIKVAISPVDTEGAKINMKREATSWDFEQFAENADKLWEEKLSSIVIGTEDTTLKKVFYTSLYHCMIAPYTYQDVDGRFLDMRRKTKRATPNQVNYSVYSLWDTFRALHPLLTIIEPNMSTEFASNLMRKASEGGILPKWPLASNYTGTMVGYPAVSVLADVLTKNLYKGDKNRLLDATVLASTYHPELLDSIQEPRASRLMTKHIYFKERTGIIPSDSISKSVSNGLEMAYYDWCIYKIAEEVGKQDIAKSYAIKADYYKNYFDPQTGFMRGKLGNGKWKTPFNPKYSSHENSDYTEGNAYQWSFLAPHDPIGLVAIYGGKDIFESKLDSLFHTSSEIIGEKASGDITGLIGQYAHGNEPSHHIAYLYNWTNSPYKTQEMLDSIMSRFYNATPNGIVGNEDCGQMSAWFVLNSLGFYQFCPGKPIYLLGRPLFDDAKIRTGGKYFTIVVHHNSKRNKYIQKVLLNGKLLQERCFKHKELVKGGKIELFMGPNKKS